MKNIFRLVCLSVFLIGTQQAQAYTSSDSVSSDSVYVDTIRVYSAKMDTTISNVVILPDSYYHQTLAVNDYPVVYLLHGHEGNHQAWLRTKPSLQAEANRWGVIIVCPDARNSWYWDSLTDKKQQYDTYVSQELVKYIDSNYRTKASASYRSISGYSMGGHGALLLAINHPDVFGACGSMSGGLDIRPYPNSWDMIAALGGSYQDKKENWERHTVINNLYKIASNTPAIIIDCGKDDFFYKVNQRVHEEMLYRNIDHDYIIRPGKHSHDYWNNAIDYQFMFFSKFFKR